MHQAKNQLATRGSNQELADRQPVNQQKCLEVSREVSGTARLIQRTREAGGPGDGGTAIAGGIAHQFQNFNLANAGGGGTGGRGQAKAGGEGQPSAVEAQGKAEEAEEV